MATFKNDRLKMAEKAENEKRWNDAIKNYSEYITNSKNDNEIASIEIKLGQVYLWGLQDYEKAERHFLNGRERKKKEADRFVETVRKLTSFRDPRIRESFIDIRKNFLKRYSQNIVNTRAINPKLKALKIEATSEETAQIRMLIYVGYKSWIKINIEVLPKKWTWEYDHFYAFQVLKQITGYGREIKTDTELKNQAREKTKEILENTLKYFERKFLAMEEETKRPKRERSRLDTPETEQITMFEQPLPISKDEIVTIKTEKSRVEVKKDLLAPPFYCAICEQKHKAGTPRMQCELCGRCICVDTFADMTKAGRTSCPMCDGKLLVI